MSWTDANPDEPAAGSRDDAQNQDEHLATVRVTISATYALHGSPAEHARAHLLALLDASLESSLRSATGPMRLLDHMIESSALVAEDPLVSGGTDFSKLLDL